MADIRYKVRPNVEDSEELWQVVKVIYYDNGR